MSSDWIKRIGDYDPERQRLLTVSRVVAGSPAAGAFQPGDLLLTLEGEPATRFREVEERSQRAAVTLQVLRDGQVLSLDIATVPLSGKGVRRALIWAGAILQAPYRDLAAQRGVELRGVYVAYYSLVPPPPAMAWCPGDGLQK